MLRQSTLALTTTLALSAWLLTACPSGGRLENGPLHDETVACPDTTALLETYCAGSACHSPRPNRDPSTPKGGADLTTPEGIAAMIGHVATGDECRDSGELLVDPAKPNASLLYRKLTGDQTCGDKMPLAGINPTSYEMYCLRQWALNLAKEPPLAAGGATGTQGNAGNGGAL